MNTHPRTPADAWRLQVLKLLQANPSLSQRQLAAELSVSLGKNPNKGKYAYILTPAGLEEKTRITLASLSSRTLSLFTATSAPATGATRSRTPDR